MAEVVWQDRAVDDFENIKHYLQENYGEYQVRKFVRRVFDFLNLLSAYPKLGPIQNKELEIRGFVISSQTTMLYKTQESKVFILGFIDNRSDPFLYK